MLRLLSQLPRALVISAAGISAAAFSAPPPSPAPVPVPYPNTSAESAATGQASGKRMYKPYVPLTSSIANTPDAPQQGTCAATQGSVNGIASDPEEGGQIAKAAKASVQPMSVTRKVDKSSPVLMDSSTQNSACR